MKIHLVVHVDGLLQRFDRVVPDTVAMLSAVRRLADRLARSPGGDEVVAWGVRFAGAGSESDLEDLPSMFGLRYRRIDRVESLRSALLQPSALESSDPAASDPEASSAVVLLCASHEIFRRARARGLDVYRLGTEPRDPSRPADFEDIPRILEEKLRIPTARPMSRIARTGGLLAWDHGDAESARQAGLGALEQDSQADWLVLGTKLVLYTEDPDFEDRLAARLDVQRLSYGVNKDRMFIERRGTEAAERLIEEAGFVLREGAASESGLPWRRLRRQILGETGEQVPGDQGAGREVPDPDGADPDGSALATSEEARAQRAVDQKRFSTEGILQVSALADWLGPEAGLDLLDEDGRIVALAWRQTVEAAADKPSSSGLWVVVFRAETIEQGIPGALGLWHRLQSDEPSQGLDFNVLSRNVLHCVALAAESARQVSADLSGEGLTSAFLLPAERLGARLVELDPIR